MQRLIDQPTAAPSRKVVSATVGSMAGAIVGGLLARYLGAPFDGAVVMGGWPVLGTFVAGYLLRERDDVRT